MTSVFINQKREKISFMENKTTQRKPSDHVSVSHSNNQNNNCSDIDSLCASVMTHDRELPQNFSSTPRLYGGVSVNENEKAALSLPPKFTKFENVDKKKCLVEI